MKGSLAFLGLAATAMAAPKGAAVTGIIKPDGGAPDSCSPDFNGKFQVTIYKIAEEKAKRDALQKRSCGDDGTLQLNLAGGVLKDAKDRTGYIADNYQFQFDGPPQAGALYTAGFSVCGNGSLALGPKTVFYQCLSGSFYNLYDRHWAEQCEPVEIVAMPCNAQAPGAGSPSQIGDGQVQGPTDVPNVSQIGDGQIQAPTGAPVSQIGDGQIQAPTNIPVVTQIGDGQIQAPTATGGAPVTQIGDGQVQAPTGAPVTQIGDGQVQAPTGAPVTQIGDGQVQAPTGAPVTQIGDGQVQAPTGTPQAPPSEVPVPGGAANALPASVAGLVALMGAVLYL